MPFLYNCRHDGDQYRISKFDEDQNVESSYLCTETECECPAGVRPMCRHREMLPLFIRRGAVNTGWQLDYDRGGWVQMYDDPEPAQNITATEIDQRMAALEGPANAIAEALVEQAFEIVHQLPAPRKSWRRF